MNKMEVAAILVPVVLFLIIIAIIEFWPTKKNKKISLYQDPDQLREDIHSYERTIENLIIEINDIYYMGYKERESYNKFTPEEIEKIRIYANEICDLATDINDIYDSNPSLEEEKENDEK